MSTEFAAIEAEAMKLPPEDRARLADHLLASLANKEVAQFDAAWAEELERRIAAVEAGHEPLVPLKDALQRARNVLR